MNRRYNMVNRDIYLAAINNIKNISETYPEEDLMDESIKSSLSYSLEIKYQYERENAKTNVLDPEYIKQMLGFKTWTEGFQRFVNQVVESQKHPENRDNRYDIDLVTRMNPKYRRLYSYVVNNIKQFSM